MRTALVIGGSSGIGLAAAVALAGSDVAVHVVGRDAAKLAAVGNAHPALTRHQADGTDRAGLDAVFSAVGTVDWLIVAMSGGAGAGRVAELDLEALRDAFDAKLFGHLTVIQAALPHLSQDGSITLVSSASARSALPATAGLAAINGAIESLVRPLAVELAPIRVNAVSPGVIDTPWWSKVPDREAYFARTAEALPVGRIGRPEDVAQALILAASNPFITGSVIECDGGARL